jgi:sterol 3beta-glucosyltransferase
MSVGTVGDVLPLTGLAARLAAEGHDVTFAVPEPFRAAIEESGFAVRAIDADVRALLHSGSRSDAPGRRRGRGSVRAYTGMIRSSSDLMVNAFDGMVASVQDADVVLVSYGVAVQGYLIAKAMGIPSMGLYLVPMTSTREFPPALLGGRSFGALGNRLAGSLGLRPLSVLSPWTRVFQRRLGLPESSLLAVDREMTAVGWPVRYGYSTAVLPRPADWPSSVDVVGYWWPVARKSWAPSAELAGFLASGPPPVLVSLGSLDSEGDGRLPEIFGAALRRAGVRGVVQSNSPGYRLDDNVLAIGEVDYSWLMLKVSAVVHRASAGTAGAALLAGIPSVPVPIAFDNAFWANRLVRIGASPGAVARDDLNAERLGYLIGSAVHDDAIRARTADIGKAIATEDSAARIVADLDAISAGRRPDDQS